MRNASNPLELVQQADLCSGCGMCQGLFGPEKVTVSLTAEGFLRPTRRGELTREQATLFADVCPGLNIRHEKGSGKHHPIWGPLLETHIAASTDDEIRYRGSSGGVLSGLQVYVLEKGIADYVVNIGASPTEPLRNEIRVCRNRIDVLTSAGSRYAPAAPLLEISKFLDAPGRFVFVGKPCDVAALRRLARHDPRVDAKVPLMLSFMCAGTPSLNATHTVVERLGGTPEQVAEFQYRGSGWPGFAKATFRDGSQQSMSYEDSWSHILGTRVQWRCKLCADGTGEFADVAGADAWHLSADNKPDFSERPGRSFLLTRTERGRAIVEAAVRDGAIEIISTSSPDEIEATQFHQSYRKKTMLVRYVALSLLGACHPNYNGWTLWRAALRLSPLAQARAFLGALKRAWRKSKSASPAS